jgi:serine/threonine-protein kinase CTR1
MDIVEGLNYLHSYKPKIIHRDLKPLNILLKMSPNGHNVKISDFGLSVEHERSILSHTQLVGTWKYMAPEVKNDKHYNEKCDIYSLGVILSQMFDLEKIK